MTAKPAKRPKMPASKFVATGSKSSPAPRANNLKKAPKKGK